VLCAFDLNPAKTRAVRQSSTARLCAGAVAKLGVAGPEAFAALIMTDAATWSAIMKAAGIKPE
jgi:hypothetical protein